MARAKRSRIPHHLGEIRVGLDFESTGAYALRDEGLKLETPQRICKRVVRYWFIELFEKYTVLYGVGVSMWLAYWEGQMAVLGGLCTDVRVGPGLGRAMYV